MTEPEFSEEQHREIVSQLYLSLLGRTPDAEGLRYHENGLRGGKSIAQVIEEFMGSAEFLGKFSKKYFGPQADVEKFPLDYDPAGEVGRSYVRRTLSGFFDKYCSGDVVLDVGFAGYANPDNKPSLPGSIGVDVDYPGYDGIHLPFADGSVDSIISSHCLEHILFDLSAIRDWYRVLRVGGFIVCMVPHQYLYEKRRFLPSQWNQDHKRMYTPAALLASFEQALEPNSYRVRHLADNDEAFDYSIGPQEHSSGAYEIELVIEKIAPPAWQLA
jgi:SAM-dependent methyltransferase